MKSIAFAPSLKSIIVAALLCIVGAFKQPCAAQSGTDPNLTLTISGTSQSVVLTWFGDVGMQYQLESSPDLATWTNLGPVITGAGAFINVTQQIGGASSGFFRLTRLSSSRIAAVFDPGTGILTITGDDQDNTIVVSRDAAGILRVNNGAVSITGGAPTVANTTLIQIFGGAGNDQYSR